MRGKVLLIPDTLTHNGITPAYAGKRAGGVKWRLMSEDHPRLCGEKDTVCHCLLPAEGSPPPMRGKVVNFDHVIAEDRITPAYAGKSLKRAKLRDVD